ncbi:ACP S-malonyltransferase [Azorhizobium doebereinerae]|uniref:ACP S-malonyltransferase n=1 Tax=Azorhizobium doebereinerae TaxID=281091 RepID=UPI00048B81E9|nr:ACP S-malonyltransferase [Azorhizobium doebereinerae]
MDRAVKACIFPGQGAQRLGMGTELFAEFPALIRRADEVLGYSIETLCREGPAERLASTRFTQPALFVVGALGYLRHQKTQVPPAFLLGHSVAEYVALFAAGVLDFETALRLVSLRGTLMGEAVGGGMAAVIGLDAPQIEAVLAKHAPGRVYAANFNTPRQIVISGLSAEVARLEPHMTAAGATFFRVLQVSGAFHTPFMAPAQEAFRAEVAKVRFAEPGIPVLSNVTARPHVPGRIAERMVEQITAPVRWCDSIRYVLAAGLVPADFEEIGVEGAAVVKPMVMRTQLEADPLSPEEFAAARQEAAALQEQDVPAAETAPPAAAPMPSFAPRPVSGGTSQGFAGSALGSRAFRAAFGVRHAYLAGGMYQGIASTDVVVRMAQAGLLGFFGSGGLRLPAIEAAVRDIQARIPAGAPYGINFIANTHFPEQEEALADLLLKLGVPLIEASAFMQVTPALVRYRLKGLARDGGSIHAGNRILAKVSRPDVAEFFLSPPPEAILTRLLASGAVTAEEAALGRATPMADAVCVEADSGGHTDQGMPLTLLPAILKVRDRCAALTPRFGPVHVGAAGGVGTPEAAAAMFVMGADFILTGSINQSTVEAATSDVVKDLLAGMNVHDTDYAPSGEMFELGSKVQVLKKGIFFPARANKLVSLYRQHEALEEIDGKTRQLIEERYFKRSLAQVFDEVCAAYPGAEVERAKALPKHRMALVFRRYFRDATRWALAGNLEHKVDFQVQCGPAQGAFNQWVAGTELASWRARHVDAIADRLMDETASLLNRRFATMLGGAA